MRDEQTIMAFDYGDMRIGIAIGNTLLCIPHPLTTVSGDGMWNKINQIEELVSKWKPHVLIVGCPHSHDDLQKIQLINTIKNFAKRISRTFNLPVELINEDFTSAHASSLLNELGIHGKEQKSKLDQLAACSILQTYFSNLV